MPPAGKPRPSSAERALLIDWIRADVQQVDCRAPDPGRITLRRLNSSEHTFTIRDLFAVDVDPSEFLPPDDSGYGFDTIGDVLSVSPLLMEKYFDAAERVLRAGCREAGCPRAAQFLFRPEARPSAAAGETALAAIPLDDWSLAARLSYLLWSTAPDDQLADLARSGSLREQLRPTVARLVADEKADRFVSNLSANGCARATSSRARSTAAGPGS